MVKKRKVSKKKLRLRREEQRRQVRGEAAPLDSALVEDLVYLAERGVLASEAQMREAMFDALYVSRRWRTEPEFTDLSFDPADTERAMSGVWGAQSDLSDQFKRLSKPEQDDKVFELNRKVVATLVTPAFKQQFFDGLSLFRQRLRSRRDRAMLAQVALVEMALKKLTVLKDGLSWGDCMLVYQIFLDSQDQYLRLAQAAEAAFEGVRQMIDQTPAEEFFRTLSETHPAASTLMQAAEKTPGLMDFLRRRAEDALDQAVSALFIGEIRLGIFTPAELETLAQRVDDTFQKAGLHRLKSTSQADLQRMASLLYETAADVLSKMDTPDRRTDVYTTARRRVEELSRQEQGVSGQAMSLSVLLKEETALGENDLLIRAYLGEMRTLMTSSAETRNDHS